MKVETAIELKLHLQEKHIDTLTFEKCLYCDEITNTKDLIESRTKLTTAALHLECWLKTFNEASSATLQKFELHQFLFSFKDKSRSTMCLCHRQLCCFKRILFYYTNVILRTHSPLAVPSTAQILMIKVSSIYLNQQIYMNIYCTEVALRYFKNFLFRQHGW